MIIDNLRQIRDRMNAAARRVGRTPDSVSLLAVIKYAPLAAVSELLASSLPFDVAESRVQDAQRRRAQLGATGPRRHWRMIGHLQTNKAKLAVETFDAVDSVDSLRLAQELDKKLEASGKTMPVLLQVKLSDKQTQSGVASGELPALLEGVATLRHLRAEGLMGIAPDLAEIEAVRPYFRALKTLFDRHFAGRPGAQLSMGMSRDFEIAIEEGSTMVRIGSALFSSKSEAPATMQPREDSNDR